MLLGGKQSEIKQVAVVTRNPQFNKLLGSILADWRFFVVEDMSEAAVVFAERGLELADAGGQVVWLSPMPLSDGAFLEVPISLTSLYQQLETNLFPTPRRHIRIALETSVDLKVDNDWWDGRLISLSDRGGRIVCSKELPRGEIITIDVKLGDKTIRTLAEVLYCIPAGDSPGRSRAQLGVLFKPKDKQETVSLRRYIEKVSVENACAREEISLSAPCLSWIDVPADPWA